MTRPDLPRATDLPTWMRTLKERYLQTEVSQFVLHGNVHDLVNCAGQSWAMGDFLGQFFEPSGKLVVHYDPGRGVWFESQEHAVRAARIWVSADFIAEQKVAPAGFERASKASIQRRVAREIGFERSPEIVLEALEVLLSAPNEPVAVLIHYAELVAPDGPVSGLGFHDRTASARLHRWSLSDLISRGDNAVVLLTGALADLSKRLTRNPRVATLQVPHPSLEDRGAYLLRLLDKQPPSTLETLARVTAGLQLRQVKDVVSPLDFGPAENQTAQASALETALMSIRLRKKEILEQECFGLIEVIEPKHGFEAVGGNEGVKAALRRVARHIHAGRTAQVPMGILCVGPMGTGKTFITKAFAKESGLAAIQLKNFRDKWVGSTEANLEKVLDVITAIGEIIVIIDEGDRSLGGAEGDGGVNSRVMARLKEFMSDTAHRGRIIFFMMTNRPDKLDTDMKRPGRFDLKIPFFAPQTTAERVSLAEAIALRYDIALPQERSALEAIFGPLDGYAAAELEALLLMAADLMARDDDGGPIKEPADALSQAARDFMPTRETTMIEYMKMLAVYEASNRRLLPDTLQSITVEELHNTLGNLRAQLADERRLL